MAGRKTMRHSEEWWSLVAPPTAVRCEAHTQDGNRCRREAIAGANVCRMHGGAIPAVKAKAAARIGNAADEMVKRLHAMLDDPSVGSTEKMKIAQDMLDRAGLNATNKLLVGVGEVDPIEGLFRDLLADPANLIDTSVEVVTVARPDPAQAALDAAASGPDWEDVYALETGISGREDVVEAELVEDERPTEVADPRPPKHIREALEVQRQMRRLI
jgi:hypothetical protein